jgi:hypothetical protein
MRYPVQEWRMMRGKELWKKNKKKKSQRKALGSKYSKIKVSSYIMHSFGTIFYFKVNKYL